MDMGILQKGQKVASSGVDIPNIYTLEKSEQKLKKEVEILKANVSLLLLENSRLKLESVNSAKPLENNTEQSNITQKEGTNNQQTQQRVRTEKPFLLRYVKLLGRTLSLNIKDSEK